VSAGLVVRPAAGPLAGTVIPPGDKSIAHRAILFNAAAEGESRVEGIPGSEDLASTLRAVSAFGVEVKREGDGIARLRGRAMAFSEAPGPIDCGNSGTTSRLLAGLLAGQDFETVLTGDASLSRRPMRRVVDPLAGFGASLTAADGCLPLVIRGTQLVPARCRLPVASAQVKTAVLLAAMQATGESTVTEPSLSRDHSEIMLAAMGVDLERDFGGSGGQGLVADPFVIPPGGEHAVSLSGPRVPTSLDLRVCGDISSAAFFVVAAVLVPGSVLRLRGVCLNPTRTGFLRVLRSMGADIEAVVEGESAGECYGTLTVRSSGLVGVDLAEEEVPFTIDELPVLAVAAAHADGVTRIRGAAELRIKEGDRVRAVCVMLSALGIKVAEHDDGMDIYGGTIRGGVEVDPAGDHRIAMSAAVAALAAEQAVTVLDPRVADVSFPGFFKELERVSSS